MFIFFLLLLLFFLLLLVFFYFFGYWSFFFLKPWYSKECRKDEEGWYDELLFDDRDRGVKYLTVYNRPPFMLVKQLEDDNYIGIYGYMREIDYYYYIETYWCFNKLFEYKEAPDEFCISSEFYDDLEWWLKDRALRKRMRKKLLYKTYKVIYNGLYFKRFPSLFRSFPLLMVIEDFKPVLYKTPHLMGCAFYKEGFKFFLSGVFYKCSIHFFPKEESSFSGSVYALFIVYFRVTSFYGFTGYILATCLGVDEFSLGSLVNLNDGLLYSESYNFYYPEDFRTPKNKRRDVFWCSSVCNPFFIPGGFLFHIRKYILEIGSSKFFPNYETVLNPHYISREWFSRNCFLGNYKAMKINRYSSKYYTRKFRNRFYSYNPCVRDGCPKGVWKGVYDKYKVFWSFSKGVGVNKKINYPSFYPVSYRWSRFITISSYRLYFGKRFTFGYHEETKEWCWMLTCSIEQYLRRFREDETVFPKRPFYYNNHFVNSFINLRCLSFVGGNLSSIDLSLLSRNYRFKFSILIGTVPNISFSFSWWIMCVSKKERYFKKKLRSSPFIPKIYSRRFRRVRRVMKAMQNKFMMKHYSAFYNKELEGNIFGDYYKDVYGRLLNEPIQRLLDNYIQTRPALEMQRRDNYGLVEFKYRFSYYEFKDNFKLWVPSLTLPDLYSTKFDWDASGHKLYVRPYVKYIIDSDDSASPKKFRNRRTRRLCHNIVKGATDIINFSSMDSYVHKCRMKTDYLEFDLYKTEHSTDNNSGECMPVVEDLDFSPIHDGEKDSITILDF